MKIFKNFFKSQSTTEVPVAEELFVESEAPNQSTEQVEEKADTPIQAFLKKDYLNIGYNDGYYNHSAEYKERYKDSLTAQFRNLISEEVERLRAEILRVEQFILQLEEGTELVERLNHKIEEFSRLIARHEEQAIQSVMGDGVISSCITRYNEGYELGIRLYAKEQGLFSGL